MAAEFWGDVKKALGAWRARPSFVLLALVFHIPFWFAPVYDWAAPIGSLMYIAYVGFVGTERLWYLATWKGMTLTPKEIAGATWSYWPRFAVLGVVSTVAYILLTVPLSGIGYLLPSGSLLEETVVRGLSVLGVDLVLTFMSPALAYTTKDPRNGMALGWRFLTEQGRGITPYALAPPLLMIGLLQRTPNEFLALEVRLPVGLVASLLYLLLKGATAAKYLRHHEVTAEPAVSLIERPGAPVP